MRKKFFNTFAILVSIFFIISLVFNLKVSTFNSSKVKETIKTLSSQTYEGRLSGNEGNFLAEAYIEDFFNKNSVIPLGESYKSEFTAIAPFKTNEESFIKVHTEGGSLIHEFEYSVDFKEDLINFRSNSITFSKSLAESSANQIINIYTRSIEVIDNGKSYLFYIPTDNNFNFRSSFLSELPYEMLVLINIDTYNKMIEMLRNNCTISVNIGYENKEAKMNNIIGYIEGRNKDLPPLVLSAHFDHLGIDGANNLYGGALDNSSGTAFLLELLRTYSTYSKPERNIIFAALNAEEFGLLGSKDFANKNLDLLKDSEVINFDMIGSSGYPITLMVGKSFENKESNLLNSILNYSNKTGVDTRVVYEDSSDHASFNNIGIESLSFCHSDLTRIHTPNDTIEYINTKAIDKAYKLIESKLNENYSPLFLFISNKNSLILSILFLILVLISKKNFKDKNNK